MGAAIQAQAVQASLISMKGLTSSLWPIHYKPLPDELLSCWLVRLAHGHGLKVQTFCNLIFGNHLQIWNRDIDRLAPSWLLNELSLRTGTSPDAVLSTTLRSYERILYRKFRLAGALHWILALKLYHRKRIGYGLQFCPGCLAEDTIPYFRKRWRVALNTFCTRHATMLLDRCSNCGVAIAIHRLDMAALNGLEIGPISYCHACRFDLRDAPRIEPISYDAQATALLYSLNQILDADNLSCNEGDCERYAVLHQLCRIMATRYKHIRLREFVLDRIGFQDIPLTGGHISFEMRPIEERHHILQLTAWLFINLESRLTAAWQARAVRYNVLLKDFAEAPDWYEKIIAGFESNNHSMHFSNGDIDRRWRR